LPYNTTIPHAFRAAFRSTKGHAHRTAKQNAYIASVSAADIFTYVSTFRTTNWSAVKTTDISSKCPTLYAANISTHNATNLSTDEFADIKAYWCSIGPTEHDTFFSADTAALRKTNWPAEQSAVVPAVQ
jgi:hypothetical protein